MTDSAAITEEVSKRMCTHMNDDHAVSVYAMAKSLLGPRFQGKITDAKLKEVTLDGCNIAVVTCKGDLCEMKRLVYPFQPRLASAAEARSRLVAIHHQVCAPNPVWLVTHELALAIIITMSLLGYGAFGMGVDALTNAIEGSPGWNSFLSMIFGSARGFSNAVWYSFVGGMLVHMAEGIYVAYQGHKVLKLQPKALIMWFLVISCVGFPMTKQYLELQKIHDNQRKENKEG